MESVPPRRSPAANFNVVHAVELLVNSWLSVPTSSLPTTRLGLDDSVMTATKKCWTQWRLVMKRTSLQRKGRVRLGPLPFYPQLAQPAVTGMTHIRSFHPGAPSGQTKAEQVQSLVRATIASTVPDSYPASTQVQPPAGSLAEKYSYAALYRCQDAITSYFRGIGTAYPLEIVLKKVLEDFTTNDIPYDDVKAILNKFLLNV